MRDLKGRTAVITGASRGIGTYIARRLAQAEMNLVLAARTATELQATAAELRQAGCQVLAVPADVTEQAAREELLAEAQRAFGSIDVLINNAGYLTIAAYDRLELNQVETAIDVNLRAPMLLTRMVLPGMLARGRGHIVNISSLAGKMGVAYLEPYCATKAALMSFTAALRLSYRGTGVSASVVSPGFVSDVGMYRRIQDDTGVQAPRLAGATSPENVAQAVVRAIEFDLPEVIVNPRPIWPLLLALVLSPRMVERFLPRIAGGVYRRAGQIYERHGISKAVDG